MYVMEGQMGPDFGICIYCIQRTSDTSCLSAFLVTGSIRNGVRKGKRMRSLGDFCPVLVLRIKGRHQECWQQEWEGLGKEDSLYSHHNFGSLLAPTSSGRMWKFLSSKCHCSRSLSSSFTYWLSLAHCSCCLAILSKAILPYFKA